MKQMKRNYVEKFKYIAGKKFQLSIKSTPGLCCWVGLDGSAVPPMVESNKKQTLKSVETKVGNWILRILGILCDTGMLVSCLLLCERNIIPGTCETE